MLHTMIELTFVKVLMLIGQFVNNGIFLDKGFKFQPYVCNGCHGRSVRSMKPKDTAILNICSVDYNCIIN